MISDTYVFVIRAKTNEYNLITLTSICSTCQRIPLLDQSNKFKQMYILLNLDHQ